MNKLLDAANLYAERGWPVLKCRPRDKRPATRHGVKDATTNLEIITGWFENDKEANIGIATGNSLAVLDVDPRNGGSESMDVLVNQYGKDWLNTLTVMTGGGGEHLYYQADQNTKNYKPAPGLDLQSNGLYVLAPPSIHPSGNPYKWEDGNQPDECPLMTLPDFLLPMKIDTLEQQAIAHHIDNIVPLIGIPEGERNGTIFKYACNLRAREMTYEEAKFLICEMATKCEPPLSENETIKCLDSAWRYIPNFNCTDTGNAKRLVYLYGEDLIHVPEFKAWMHWDSERWLFDHSLLIRQKAKKTAQTIYVEASSATEQTIRKKKAIWAANSENAPRIKSMIELACSEPGIVVQQQQLDSNSMVLGVDNGTLELLAGTLREPRREDYITKRASVSFNPDATCPNWVSFLKTIMDGDKELILYIQKMMGYMMTGDTREQCIFIAYGTGANGKSTFANILKALLGDYCLTTPAETLMVKRYSGGATPDLARLRGARLVLSSEPEEGSRLAESLVKQLTGQDTITARSLYCNPFEYRPNFKILLSTNHHPIIIGDDNAIWRRIHLIPFNVTIPPGKQDKTLLDKLLLELPGILNWALEGCLDWQCNGLTPPVGVKAATDEYRDNMDILSTWIDECCVVSTKDNTEDLSSPTNALYVSYNDYCKNAGLRPISSNAFSRKLHARGFERNRNARIRGFKGIALRGSDLNGGKALDLDIVIIGGQAVGISKDTSNSSESANKSI